MSFGGHRSSGEVPRRGSLVRKAHLFVVDILRGENLIACDMNGKSDPYFIATWKGGSGISSEPLKSPIIFKTLSPNWWEAAAAKGEQMRTQTAPTTTANIASLYIEVWDKDKVGKDDFIVLIRIHRGCCTIQFTPAVRDEVEQTAVQKFFPLEPRAGKKDKVKGEIVVRLSMQVPGEEGVDTVSRANSDHSVTVQILKGEKLKAMDANGKSDPFFIARWQGGNGFRSAEFRSSVIKSTLNPNWAALATQKRQKAPTMTFEPNTLDECGELCITLYDKDTVGNNDFMGYCAIKFNASELKAIDGKWTMVRASLGDEGAPATSFGSVLGSRSSSAFISRTSSRVSGCLLMKVLYQSAAFRTEREKMRDEAQKRIAKVKGDLAFDKSNHPLIVACVLDSEKYLNLVNSMLQGLVTRKYKRKALTYGSCFEGMDAVDYVLYVLQSEEDWAYETLSALFDGDNKMLRTIGGPGHSERCLAYVTQATLGGKGWSRGDAGLLIQKMLDDKYLKRMTSGDAVFKDAKTLYAFESPGKSELESLKKRTGQKSLGRAMRASGLRPNFPVVLVPGLASSALEVWDSEEAPEWIGERVWIDINKIGSLAQLQKIKNMLRSKSDEGGERKWLRHICPSEDGWSDPSGIKVRPCEGLGAIDYLSHNPLTMKPTYVWAFVIRALIDLGYDRKNLIAAPYDWRVPPPVLESRDGFFSKLKADVEVACKTNGERVVLIGHSMGNRNVQWFLWWLQQTDPDFIKKNIHAYMALGAPLLGATKVIRSFMTGDALGLDMFLDLKEGLHFAHRLGSLPWLLPLYHPMYTNPIARVRSEETTPDRDGDWDEGAFTTPHPFSLVKKHAIRQWATFNKFYGRCEWFLDRSEHNGSCTTENGEHMKIDAEELPPILKKPPVDNIWCIYGVNLDTETAYYFKDKGGKLSADTTMDKESCRITPNNPSGLKINTGVGYETSDTSQPFLDGACRSGDGTLPYSSMAYARVWQQQEGGNVDIIEVEGAEHREMMSDECIIYHILQYVATGENAHAEHPSNKRDIGSEFRSLSTISRDSVSRDDDDGDDGDDE